MDPSSRSADRSSDATAPATRVAVVGPASPYAGGVVAHTAETAHRLAAAGARVELVAWSRLLPERLYPGERAVPDGGPDVPPFEHTRRPLRWDRPQSWWRTGRSLRGHDIVVVVVVVPAQVPALLALVRGVRPGWAARRHGQRAGGPRVVVLAHNVVPHETHLGATWLTTRMFAAADAVLVHSPPMADLARRHGARRVAVAQLPPHLPGGVPTPATRAASRAAAARRRAAGEPLRVLCLGMVREYKGVDLLLEAARDVPDVHVTVAGEQWGRAGERVRELAALPGLADRVRLLPGYVPAAEVPALLAAHDLLALPYRSGTASQNVLLAHAHGLPVLATRVGTFPTQVRDGVDGVLVPPADVSGLCRALQRLGRPGTLERLQAAVPRVDGNAAWATYVEALLAAPDGGPR